jgi:cell filamentation protein
MYEVADDTYCYPGTTVLRNLANLQDPQELADFEAEMTDLRASEPIPVAEMDAAYYFGLHRHLFQDVYAWAGQPRTVRISKGGNAFCFPEHIPTQMSKLFAELKADDYLRGLDGKTFAAKAAHFLAELNAIHPFREGNGRTQLSFLVLLADACGHPINTDRMDPERVMDVMIEASAVRKSRSPI